MNYPAAELRSIVLLFNTFKQRWLLSEDWFIRFSLVFDIRTNDGFVSIQSDGIDVIAARPEHPSPKHLFDVRMLGKDLLCCNTLDRLHHA